jgi:O-acetyl-ADP-ribose deacetylase
MVQIEIILEDITKLQVDAIVNAANSSLLGGGGVDGAIHRAAGPGLLRECESLNGCKTGEAKITKGYNLPAKYVIHTVGPIWSGGNQNESELLSSCYTKSLKIAEANNLKTVAFPSISTGVYQFPKHEASKIAIEAILKFIKQHSQFEKIIFCCFDQETYNIYKQIRDKYIDFYPVRDDDEIRTVAKLAYEIWNEHYVPIIGQDQVAFMVDKFQSFEAITKQIKEEDYEYYIIYHAFDPSGYIGIKPSGDELFLSKFYVLKNKRGKGLGRKGIEFILKRANDLGNKSISLTVNKENVNSIKAYEQMGFKNLGPIVTDIGEGFIMDDYVMKYFMC